MQVQFTRTTTSQQKLFKAKTWYVLAAVIVPTSEEMDLFTRHDLWKDGIWIERGEEGAKSSFTLVLKELLNGFSFKSEIANDITAAEMKIIEELQVNIQHATKLDSFNGTPRVYEVTSDKYEPVA